MRRTTYLFVCLLLMAFTAMYAQDVQITGLVNNADDGEPLPGVSVVVKGTRTGISTDVKGTYALQAPAGATLVFSAIGLKTVEVAIAGQSVINISMEPEAIGLDEVVVTALGISRERKALGYAVQEVSASDLARSGEQNVLNSLAAKVAGLQVISSGGTPGASSKVLIRGNSSFTGNNQPLIVVDGIPIDNSTQSTVAKDFPYNANLAGVNNSNRAIDIAPEDIESVTVMKGASAAALYGARAANGAIIYTTKKGRSSETRVTYSISAELNQVNRLPEEQMIYTQGSIVDGVPTHQPLATANSWGPKASDLNLKVYNNSQDFFRNALGFNHNLAIVGGDVTNNYRLSINRLDQDGIIQNSDFNRTSIRLNTTSQINSRLTANSSISYSNSYSTKVQNGSNLAGIMLPLLRAPIDFNLSDYENPDGTNKSYLDFYDNPYWTAYNNPFTDNIDRLLGQITLNYQILDWLSASYKFGTDIYTDKRKQIFAIGSNALDDPESGQIEENSIHFKQYYQDVMISIDRSFTEKLKTSLIMGGNLWHQNTDILYGRGRGLSVKGFYNMSNATELYADQDTEIIRNSALFFSGDISWDAYLYLNITGRNDWSSTFGKEKNNFFYPSASLSFVFSELLPKTNIFDFGKLRLANARGGNSPEAYTSQTYYVRPFFADGFTDGNSFPFFGLNGYSLNTILGNENLKPEKTNETELGLEMRFLQNRMGFDLTYYNKMTTDILVSKPIAGSTGFQAIVDNSGEMQNKGVEILFNIKPIRTNNLLWAIDINFARNKNTTLKLAEGVTEISVESAFTSIGSYAIKGDPYGVLYATRWKRNVNGDLIIGANGLPIVADTRGNIGNPFPDWIGGLRNTVSYKGVTLSALLDVRKGGKIWNGTISRLHRLGKTLESADRDRTYLIPGLLEDGTPNTTTVSALNYFSHYLGDGALSAAENSVFDGSWIRLRDVSVGYRYNLQNTKSWFKYVELTLSGRNLWLHTKYDGVDPETSLTGADSNLTGFDYFNNPGTKTYLLGLKFGIL